MTPPTASVFELLSDEAVHALIEIARRMSAEVVKQGKEDLKEQRRRLLERKEECAQDQLTVQAKKFETATRCTSQCSAHLHKCHKLCLNTNH